MAAFAAIGFMSIRKNVEDLRVISQDNTHWTASQMEIELLRFRLEPPSAAQGRQTQEALDDMHERFDILWSRVFIMRNGRVGESLMRSTTGSTGRSMRSPTI